MTLCEGKHLATVTFTHRWRDWFQMRWWVRCWNCDLKLGPFVHRAEADARARELYRSRG